ncbi:MAG TPA: hypothetical protein VN426_14165 [Syntrophomonadaceae bacterium]|nr:hypothetical protein [Syntrophomonadaceae bacterium]
MSVKEVNPASNCYRAILAQVNYLDSVYTKNVHLKEIYQDLTELAFYMMENDGQRVLKGIEQVRLTLNEIEGCSWKETEGNLTATRLILTEIKTHLQYLLIEFGREDH